MSFEEKLISEIRDNSIIYDIKSKSYKKNQVKEKIWKEISIKLNVPGKY